VALLEGVEAGSGRELGGLQRKNASRWMAITIVMVLLSGCPW